MNTVIGVDPSTMKQAAVILREDGFEICVNKTKAKDMPTRCLEAFRWIRKMVRDEDAPVTVFVELPMSAGARGGIKALLPLAQIQGALVAGALSGGATVHQVYVQVWKKSVIGSGNASKLKIKMYLKKTWPVFYLESEGDIDICDAGAISLHGWKQAAGGGPSATTRRLGRGSRVGTHRPVPVAPGQRKVLVPLVKDSKSKPKTR